MKHRKTVLKNGLRIVTVPMKGNPTATVMVLVEAGSKYETKEINGISHFLEHLCFKGTQTRTGKALNLELDGLGARTNAFTSLEMTGYFAKGRHELAPKLLEIISDLYLNPTLPADEIEREKGVILGEINMYEDMPQAKVSKLFAELAYGDQPAGWSILGPKDVIKALDRSAIEKYRNRMYVPEATAVVVAGDVSHVDIVRQVRDMFGALPPEKRKTKKKVIEQQARPKVVSLIKQTDQTHLIMGYRTVPALHKDTVPLDIVSALLGAGMSSRLFVRLREEMGVGYYVRADNGTLTDHGMLAISAGVDSNRLHEVVMALLEECNRLCAELVSVQELKKTKQYLLGNFEMSLESSDEAAEFYGIQEILRQPILSPKEVAKRIKAVTAKDVQRVAKKYLTAKGLNLAYIGPQANESALRKLLENQTS